MTQLRWSERSTEIAEDVRSRLLPVLDRETGSTWDREFDNLLRIRQLPDDWDGQGAPAPSTELVDSALVLALHLRQSSLPAPDRIVPGVAGTIVMEWQTKRGRCLELEVVEPYLAEWFDNGPFQEPNQIRDDRPAPKYSGVS